MTRTGANICIYVPNSIKDWLDAHPEINKSGLFRVLVEQYIETYKGIELKIDEEALKSIMLGHRSRYSPRKY